MTAEKCAALEWHSRTHSRAVADRRGNPASQDTGRGPTERYVWSAGVPTEPGEEPAWGRTVFVVYRFPLWCKSVPNLAGASYGRNTEEQDCKGENNKKIILHNNWG